MPPFAAYCFFLSDSATSFLIRAIGLKPSLIGFLLPGSAFLPLKNGTRLIVFGLASDRVRARTGEADAGDWPPGIWKADAAGLGLNS